MTIRQSQINDWADEILEMAMPGRTARAASPPRFAMKPKPQQPLKPRPSYVQRRPALLPVMVDADYAALADLLSWSQRYAEATQDASHTVTWSWSPMDGLWYVWTTSAEAEAPALADAIGDLLSQLEPL